MNLSFIAIKSSQESKQSSHSSENISIKEILQKFKSAKQIKAKSQQQKNNSLEKNTLLITKNEDPENKSHHVLKIESTGSQNGYMLITKTYTKIGYSFISLPSKLHKNDLLSVITSKNLSYKDITENFTITLNGNIITLSYKKEPLQIVLDKGSQTITIIKNKNEKLKLSDIQVDDQKLTI